MITEKIWQLSESFVERRRGMRSLEVWIPFLAFVLMALSTALALWPPAEAEKYKKFIVLAIVIAIGVVLFVMSIMAGLDNKEAAEKAEKSQQHLEAVFDKSRKEFRDFRQEIVEARKKADAPGTAEEKLNVTLESLNKALGQSATAVNRPTPPPAQMVNPSNNPAHFNGVIGLQAGKTVQLSELLRQNGYSGQPLLFMLEICVPDSSPNGFLVGQSNVTEKNGFPYTAGECNTLWNQDATQLFLFAPQIAQVKLSATSK